MDNFWIIEEIEREKSKKEEEIQIPLYAPLYEPYETVKEEEQKIERGVIIIEL